MTTSKQHFGERIRLLRLQQGMSQEQLALSAHMNTSYLGQLERGTKNPTLRTLNKIASGLQMTVEELITEKSEVTTGQIFVNNQQYLTLITSQQIKQIVVEAIRENCRKL